MKRIMEALRAARKIEIVLVLVFIAVLAVIVMDQGSLTASDAGSEEARLEKILSSIEGAGRVNIMLSGTDGAYRSCVVIAEGGDDMRIILKIQRAVQAATEIPPEKIEIIASGG